jgi:hypothetical protein
VHLSLAHEVIERAQCLLERRLDVEAVRLQQVHVVGAEPLERALERLGDVLAREPAVVGVRPGGPVHLGEDLDRVAAHAAQRKAEEPLGLALVVDVGGVERRHPGVEGRAHAGSRDVLADLPAVGDPVAVGDRRHHHSGAAEVAVLHRGAA